MHILAMIVGGALMLNCGFCLAYMLRVMVNVRSHLRSQGIKPGFFVGPPVVPILHTIGLVVGLALFAWGVSE